MFFTDDDEVIKLMRHFLDIRTFYIKTWSYIADDKEFYHYPIYKKDIEKMPDKEEIKKQLKEIYSNKPSGDFESYWLRIIGSNLYHKFIDKYSKKMWGIKSNKELSIDFNWVSKNNPIRKEDTRLYKNMFQGYPIDFDGYNQYFDKALFGCKFVPECKIKGMKRRIVKTNKGDFTANIIVNTISVDTLFNNKFGKLKYSGREMLKLMLPVKQILPDNVAWVHYSGDEPFTRMTEFKKITNYKSNDTLLGIEIPSKGQHYPLPIESEKQKFKKYKKLFPKNFYSIGRLGSYTYKGIPDAMKNTLDLIKTL